MRKSTVIIFLVFGVVAALAASAWGYWRWRFPYGHSHCCIVGVKFALESYAEEHGGRYPSGEASSEASLSLLYRSGHLDPYTLRGMTIPEQTTRSILKSGNLLSPQSCGWHYVEGLTQADDRRLALLWCKEPLGHKGGRTFDGGRQGVFVGGEVQWLSGAKWPDFLRDQKRLLVARSTRAVSGTPLVTASIELPDGTRLDRLDCPCTVTRLTKGPDFSSGGTSSGGFDLVWYHPPLHEGYVTRTLSFSNLISEPVTVYFTNGLPDVTNIIFRMKGAR